MFEEEFFKKSPYNFYILLVVLSIPFWVFGAMAKQFSRYLPMNLPVSALMVFCPMITAVILVYKEKGSSGVTELLKRIFDFKKIKNKVWYVPIICFMPALLLLSYFIMIVLGMPLPEPQVPFLSIPLLFVVFFITAIGEEVGWIGYVIEPMLRKWSALKTGIILGAVWALWHIIPYIQTNRGYVWIAWQCFFTIGARVVMVWIYLNTGKSMFSSILFHTMINVSDTLFPNNGSNYNPTVTGILAAIAVCIILCFWDSKSFTKYRYA